MQRTRQEQQLSLWYDSFGLLRSLSVFNLRIWAFLLGLSKGVGVETGLLGSICYLIQRLS